jgi:hypothetical protein
MFKRILLAAALLASGAAVAGNAEYRCSDGYDRVELTIERIHSDMVRTTITIDSITLHNRKPFGATEYPKDWPTLTYSLETGALAFDGKACEEVR